MLLVGAKELYRILSHRDCASAKRHNWHSEARETRHCGMIFRIEGSILQGRAVFYADTIINVGGII